MTNCEFCTPIALKDWKEFKAWKNTNPYNGDKQVDEEGIRYAFKKNTFYIACQFDGGYIGDERKLKFKFCPMCGRAL